MYNTYQDFILWVVRGSAMKFADMRTISAEFLTAARKPQAATANLRGFLRVAAFVLQVVGRSRIMFVKVPSNKYYPRKEHPCPAR